MESFFSNGSNIIFKGEGKITGVVVAGIGGASGITIYDGENTSGDIIGKVYAASGTTEYVSGKCFKTCRNGCYVAVADANAYYTIGYEQ